MFGKKWNRATSQTPEKLRVIGPCGFTTFRVVLPADDDTAPLTLMLQARISDGVDAAGHSEVSSVTFERAVALVRFIHQDLALSHRAKTAEMALSQSPGRNTVLSKENARLTQPFERQSKPLPVCSGIQPAAGTHVPPIVQAMVAYVHQHYHRPMSLGEVAAALKMNAAYLCGLFSRHLGVTFHHYLVEVRMAKARELLLDPKQRVCEVACAVGYASADQFRHAFKAHAGVPPSAWRS